MRQETCEWCSAEFSTKHTKARFCSRYCAVRSRNHRPPIDLGDGTAIVPLTRGKAAIIDAEDIERVSRYAWQCLQNGYAYNRTAGYLHRYLIEPSPGMEVDHIDGDRLNNRRSTNLRTCTVAENRRNRRPYPSNPRHKGTCLHKASGLWFASIKVDGERKSLGYFKDRGEAAKAYDQAAIKYHGEFAHPNHIKGGQS